MENNNIYTYKDEEIKQEHHVFAECCPTIHLLLLNNSQTKLSEVLIVM